MHKAFEINWTKINGFCQSGTKAATHNFKIDLPALGINNLFGNEVTFWPSNISHFWNPPKPNNKKKKALVSLDPLLFFCWSILSNSQINEQIEANKTMELVGSMNEK